MRERSRLELIINLKGETMASDINLYVIDKVDKPYSGGTVSLLNGVPIGRGVGVRLPSGMTHWFDDEKKARASDYWPKN